MYYFYQPNGKWIEVESSLTDEKNTGQIHVNSPVVGKYLACVEGYSKADCMAMKAK